MIGLVKKNLGTMLETTNKKRSLKELEKINRLTKEEMGEFLGGSERPTDRKRGITFFGFISPSPCQGDLPQ
ncbi:MAG: hypothetical protein RLY31_1910 [Bacteroidota bacterium]|jgi:hypothetical protein